MRYKSNTGAPPPLRAPLPQSESQCSRKPRVSTSAAAEFRRSEPSRLKTKLRDNL